MRPWPAIRRGILAAMLALLPHGGFAQTAPVAVTDPYEKVSGLCDLRTPFAEDLDFLTGAGVNAVFPGVGYLVNGQKTKGMCVSLASASLLGGALYADSRPGGDEVRNNLLAVYQNLGFMTAWDAYYSRLETRRREQGWDTVPARRPGLQHYLTAPVTPSVVFTWEVLVPMTIALGLGWAVMNESDPAEHPETWDWAEKQPLLFGQTTLIGTGEELLFRGVAIPEITAQTGSRRVAFWTQAGIFGMGHLDPDADWEDNAWRFGFSSLFGLYSGWVSMNREDGLRKAVAMHMWWDMIVFSVDYLEDGVSEPFLLRYAIPF